MNVDHHRLAAIANLPEDHPDRIEFCRDAHQRTLLIEYLAFLEAEPAEGSRPEAARAALGQFLEASIAASPGSRRIPSPRPGWAMRVALVAAAIAVIAIGVQFTRTDIQPPARVQRGGSRSSFRPVEASVLGERVEFRWTAVAGTEDYIVVITAVDLTEAFRSGATADTLLSVQVTDIGAPGDYTWRVIARSQGDVLEQSSLGVVQLP